VTMQRCVDRFRIGAAAHGVGIDVEDMRKPAASRAGMDMYWVLCNLCNVTIGEAKGTGASLRLSLGAGVFHVLRQCAATSDKF